MHAKDDEIFTHSIQYTSVTDRRTEGQTDIQSYRLYGGRMQFIAK